MTVRVRLFASLRERVGAPELLREVDPGTTVRTLVGTLGEEFPALGTAGRFATAVNAEYVDQDLVLQDGDELALIPPVSGGCLAPRRPE